MFNLTIETSGAAFDDYAPHECARILKRVVARLEAGDSEGTMRDINGNIVGHWQLRSFDLEGNRV